MEKERQRLKETWINPKSEDIDQLNQILKNAMSREASGEDLLRRPEMTYSDSTSLDRLVLHWKIGKLLSKLGQVKYDGYISVSKMKLKNHCVMKTQTAVTSITAR